MDQKISLSDAMYYCGFTASEYYDRDAKVFLRSLRAVAPDFKGFGDLIEGNECDEEQGVSEEAWDAIKDAVKEDILSQGEK